MKEIDFSKYNEFRIGADLKDYLQNYMARSFYPCFISSGKNRNGEHTVLTTCSEEIFHKIKDRALCEKLNAEHPGYFCVTADEYQDLFFMAELKKIMGDRTLLIYDPDDKNYEL